MRGASGGLQGSDDRVQAVVLVFTSRRVKVSQARGTSAGGGYVRAVTQGPAVKVIAWDSSALIYSEPGGASLWRSS